MRNEIFEGKWKQMRGQGRTGENLNLSKMIDIMKMMRL